MAVVFAKAETRNEELMKNVSEAGYSVSIIKREKVKSVLNFVKNNQAISTENTSTNGMESKRITADKGLNEPEVMDKKRGAKKQA